MIRVAKVRGRVALVRWIIAALLWIGSYRTLVTLPPTRGPTGAQREDRSQGDNSFVKCLRRLQSLDHGRLTVPPRSRRRPVSSSDGGPICATRSRSVLPDRRIWHARGTRWYRLYALRRQCRQAADRR